jgi:hypothetical protein
VDNLGDVYRLWGQYGLEGLFDPGAEGATGFAAAAGAGLHWVRPSMVAAALVFASGHLQARGRALA